MLRDELLVRKKADQEMRFKRTLDQRVDRRNTAWLKKIIKEYGWPDRKLVGKQGSSAAWLLAQHADHDLVFQKDCLVLMLKSFKAGLVEAQHVALLTDRVKVRHGQRQVYGTQFYRRKNGRLYPRPIKDKKGLAERRKKMGLGSFEEYQKRMLARDNDLQKQ